MPTDAAPGSNCLSSGVVHDEFADWMQTDDYRNAVPNIVGRLSVKARAAGRHFLVVCRPAT